MNPWITSCGSLIPFTRANAQWVIHGFNKHFNLIYTAELILCFTISVFSATRHNIRQKQQFFSGWSLACTIMLEKFI